MPNIRFRYSLLTLLILTALVAGGVKLWHGPHHVVERLSENGEAEYTFTRDWHGNRVVRGPLISRLFEKGELRVITIYYYQRGNISDWIFRCDVNHIDFSISLDVPWNECRLSPEELAEFHQARDAELQRNAAVGKTIQNKLEGRMAGGFSFDPNRQENAK